MADLSSPAQTARAILVRKAETAQVQAASYQTRTLTDRALARAEAYWDAVRTLDLADQMA